MIFSEKQRFNQKWIYALLIVSFALAFFLKWNESNTFSVQEFFPLIIIFTLVILFLRMMKLETKMDDHSLSYRFFPFIGWRKFEWKNIEEIHVRQYKPLLEFGGWGIRYNFGYWAYTMGGNQGIQVRLKNGKQFLVGTQQVEKVSELLKKNSML